MIVTTTTSDVSDNIIGLNRGASSNANDSGLIIERGSTGDNAAFLWDETADKFIFGTTTATPASTGNVSFTPAPFGGKGLWTTTSAVTHWGPGVDGTAYGTLTWDTGYAAVHANGSNVLRLGSGSDTDAVIIDGSDMTVAGNVTLNSRLTFEYNGSGTGNNYLETGTNSLHFKNSGGTSAFGLNFSNLSATFGGNVTINGDTSSPHTDNAFVVNRGSNGDTVLRIQNSGEVVVQNNYFYAAGSGVSMYVQNTAVFRGSIMNDSADNAPVRINDTLKVDNDANIHGNLYLHNVDTNTSSETSALFVNGSTKEVEKRELGTAAFADVDTTYNFNMSTQLSANTWTDTGIDSSDMVTGTYIMQVEVSDYSLGGGHYSEFYSATMSFYGSGTNQTGDSAADEIPIHRAGHAPNNGDIQFRTLRGSSANLKLQVKHNLSYSAAPDQTTGKTFKFKFRKMI